MKTIRLHGEYEARVVPGRFPELFRDGTAVPINTKLRDLLDRLCELVAGQAGNSARAHDLRRRIQREMDRSSLYAVTLHHHRHYFDGSGVREKPPEWGRERFLDGKVYHLDVPSPSREDRDTDAWEGRLMRACKKLAPLHLLGVKPRDDGVSGVFLPTCDFKRGLEQAFGTRIATSVLEQDRLDRLQFLTILAHREGKRASTACGIPFPAKVDDDPRFDGLIADLDSSAWQLLLASFQLPVQATWLQVSVLDKEDGLATKGALRLCPDGRTPATYPASWKIGLPGSTVASSSILVHESDRTYRPRSTINLQMAAFNFTHGEQKTLLDGVFVPEVRRLLDYEWTQHLFGVDRLLAAGADLRLEPVCERVNRMRRRLALESVQKIDVAGVRAKVVPDPGLPPFTVRLPRDTYEVGRLVDITRDPSLPLGNSTQRYRVVGISQGRVIEVGPEPWMTVQGGDFDGDDACVQDTTVRLFPQKSYDTTPVSVFREGKTTWRSGVEDPKCRFEQALRVVERPIGPNDLLARRLLEDGRLDSATRMQLSVSIQSAIDSAKHAVRLVDHGIRTEKKDYAIDAIRRGDLESPAITGTVYETLVREALRVATEDLQPVSFDPMPIRLAWAALAARFPKEALAEPSRLAGLYHARFARLLKTEAGNIQFDKLADEFMAEAESVARLLESTGPDLDGSELELQDLCTTCVEIAVLRFASIHFAARVVRMRTLRLVFDPQSPFVRRAMNAARTDWQRRLGKR